MLDAKNINYTFLYMKERETNFLKTLIQIYEKRSELTWKYKKNIEQSDVLFVGDCIGSTLEKEIKKSHQIISFHEGNTFANSAKIYKASFTNIATDILTKIELCESDFIKNKNAVTIDDIKSGLCYIVLFKWPRMNFLQLDSSYAVMATLLIDNETELNLFIEKTGQGEEHCLKFINEASRLGYLKVMKYISPPINHIEMAEQKSKAQKKISLFSRIRSSLGLGKGRDS